MQVPFDNTQILSEGHIIKVKVNFLTLILKTLLENLTS